MRVTRVALKVLNGLMLVAFVLSVVVQYNDPDPFAWMVIYGAAAVACAFFARDHLHWGLPAATALAAFVWMATLAPQVVGKVGFSEMVESMGMKDTRVEVAREAGGLFIVGVWMTVLAVVAWLQRKKPALAPSPDAA